MLLYHIDLTSGVSPTALSSAALYLPPSIPIATVSYSYILDQPNNENHLLAPHLTKAKSFYHKLLRSVKLNSLISTL